MGPQGKPFGKSFLSPGLVWGKFWASRLWGEKERERGCNCQAHCTTVHQTPTSHNPHELSQVQEKPRDR